MIRGEAAEIEILNRNDDANDADLIEAITHINNPYFCTFTFE